MFSKARTLACKSSISALISSLRWLLGQSDHKRGPGRPPVLPCGWGTFFLNLLGALALFMLLVAALYAPEVLR